MEKNSFAHIIKHLRGQRKTMIDQIGSGQKADHGSDQYLKIRCLELEIEIWKIKGSPLKSAEDEEKLQKLNKKLESTLKKIIQKKKEMAVEPAPINPQVFEWPIFDCSQKIKRGIRKFESGTVRFPGYKFGFKARFHIMDSVYAAVSFCFLDTEDAGKPLDAKELPRISFNLRQQSEGQLPLEKMRGMRQAFNPTVFEKYSLKLLIGYTYQFEERHYDPNGSLAIDIYIYPN